MHVLEKIRRFENLHIAFWLIKDTCWMLELKWLGAIVMIPTLYLAVYLVIKTYKTPGFLINLSVFFWIFANSYWMMMEFFNHNHYKNLASIPFALGFIFVGIFYLKYEFKKTPNP